MSRALWLLIPLVAGCGTKTIDSCAAVTGTCLDAQLEGSSGTSLDRAIIHVSGAGIDTVQDGTVVGGGTVTLPVAVALLFPQLAAGVRADVTLEVTAQLHGDAVASGSTAASVVGGQHATAHVTLGAVATSADLAVAVDDLSIGGGTDLAAADLASPIADLAVGSDLAGCSTLGGACCGSVCGVGECFNQACRCPLGSFDCNGACVNLARDHANCGTCGNVCGAGQLCSVGSCVATCAVGLTACAPGNCVDLKSDPNNCNSCGHACGAGMLCSGGSCVADPCSTGACNCPPGSTSCATECAITTDDPNHCGTCTVQCSAAQVCGASACTATCAVGTISCNRACVDTQTDPHNCGACEIQCAAPKSCVGGVCA
jgi:hypothetical protein